MAYLTPLVPFLFIIPLIIFWLMMFRDMLDSDSLPNLVTGDAKTDWTLAFVFLNVFAAVLYYSVVYRNRK